MVSMLSTKSAKYFKLKERVNIMKIDTEKLDILIADKGMMLKDVATASGLSEIAFRNIRQGKANPRLKTLGRIASALNVSVKDLIIKEGD